MKKIISIIFISLAASCAIAKTSMIKPSASQNQETIFWEFNSRDDGMVFLLGPESDHSLLIKVDPYLSNGRVSDAATVHCNGKINRIMPGKSITCYGSFANVVNLSIDPQDFKNGSKGTYTFVPLNNN